MSEPGVSVAVLERGDGERFQTLRRQLGVSSFGINLIVLAARRARPDPLA